LSSRTAGGGVALSGCDSWTGFAAVVGAVGDCANTVAQTSKGINAKQSELFMKLHPLRKRCFNEGGAIEVPHFLVALTEKKGERVPANARRERAYFFFSSSSILRFRYFASFSAEDRRPRLADDLSDESA
jgi:hypothetical protein